MMLKLIDKYIGIQFLFDSELSTVQLFYCVSNFSISFKTFRGFLYNMINSTLLSTKPKVDSLHLQ